MANITCAACQESLIWYSADQLPEGERQQIARHLETCAACRQELAQWRAIGAQMRQARAVLTPPHREQIWQGIQGQIANNLPSSTLNGAHHMEFEEQPTPVLVTAPARFERPRRRAWFALVASILMVALAVGVFALRGHSGNGAVSPSAGEQALSKDVGSLSQVNMVSSTEGWAIGWRKAPSNCSSGVGHPNTNSSPGAPMLHYHDGTWWEVNTPYSSHPCASLEALDMLSPDEGWAVGYTIPADLNQWIRCFAMHYLNGSWHDVPMNNCLGGPSALYASSPQDIWMIGELSPLNANVTYGEVYGSGDTAQATTLLMHYDGHTWQHVIDPHFSQVAATAIWGSGADDITVLGHDAAQDPPPTVKGSSAGKLGVQQTNFVAHYDGHTWTRKPGLATEEIDAVAPVSAHEAWAVGASVDASGQYTNNIVHYHDGIWDAPVKLAKDISVDTIAMVSPTEGWAVGSSVVHYTNGEWKTVIATLPANAGITSLAMTSATDGWAVGATVGSAAGIDQGLIIHFTNGTWTTVWRSSH